MLFGFFNAVAGATVSALEPPSSVSYLIAAGGGAGGYSYDDTGSVSTSRSAGSGGGGGGLLIGTASVTADTLYSVVAGAGGDASYRNSNAGQNSTFGALVAYGGAEGVAGILGTPNNQYADGIAGGSGSGAISTISTSTGTGGAEVSGQGYPGGAGYAANYSGFLSASAGGGGAGGPGGNAGDSVAGAAGLGVSSDITGFNVTYSAGGAGNYSFILSSGTRAFGLGTGGKGASNTGGSAVNRYAQSGGHGRVVIRYPMTYAAATAVGNVTYSEVAGDRIYIFDVGSGSITFPSTA